jgi:hypothetical protein
VGKTTARSPEDIPPPAESGVSPDLVRSYRWQLTPGEDVIDTTTWAGAPLRLRNEIELGFKQVKWIKGIEFVAHYTELGSGYGGYNQDHEFFGYRQSI